jgi:hypothetical protein
MKVGLGFVRGVGLGKLMERVQITSEQGRRDTRSWFVSKHGGESSSELWFHAAHA